MDVLAHVAAPSSRFDDQKRLQQAQAYSTFRCAKKHDLQTSGRVIGREDGHSSDASFLEDSQLAITALESQLSCSSSQNACAKRAPLGDANESLPIAASASFNRELFRPSAQKSLLAPLQHSPAVIQSVDSRWSESNDVTDQLPSSYSLTDEQSHGQPHGDGQAGSSQLARDASTADDALPVSVLSRPRNALPLPLPASARPAPPESSSDKPATTSNAIATASMIPAPAARKIQWSHPQSLRPPIPETSMAEFETHITPALQSLTENPSLAKVYLPKATKRPLRMSERGFWAFDARTWSLDEQEDFWTFMARIMDGGTCGWNVWCSSTAGQDTASNRLGLVRVFCWGQIVQHVYLLLYVASKSRIKRVDCAWIDADEQVVVDMATTRTD